MMISLAIILPFASCIHRKTFNIIMMTGMVVIMMAMLPMMLKIVLVKVAVIMTMLVITFVSSTIMAMLCSL